MLALKIENQKLDDRLKEVERAEPDLKESGMKSDRYFTHHQASVQTTESQQQIAANADNRDE